MSKKNHESYQEESPSEKKDPELFENEPIDMQPSRRGRVVSTMIVIVVAILVIWVFARNNEEPAQEAVSEETTQEDTAVAEALPENNETAETADPEAQLTQLRDDFNRTWQATTEEITASTEMALNNFDDKKTAASEKLAEISDTYKKSADKLIDQGLASAKKKVESLSQTNLKSLASLQTKTLAKTTAEQLEAALPKANEQLSSAKEQVVSAISDNTDKLTATIDQAVSKAIEQNDDAKQKLAEQTVTESETEVKVTETETTATEEMKIEETKPVVTGESIEVIAETGDSITKLARKALASAMDSGKVSKDLNAEQRIYIEDYLQNRTGSHWIAVGDTQSFSLDTINEAVDLAQKLTEAQQNHLQMYSSHVSF